MRRERSTEVVLIEAASHADGTAARSRPLVESLGLLLTVRPITDAEGTLTGQLPEAPAAVLLGPHLLRPIAIARQVYQALPLVQMVFLADDGGADRLREETAGAVMIGTYWSVARLEQAELASALRDGVQSTAQRQKLRTTLDRMNVRLAERPATDSAEFRKLVVSDRHLSSLLAHAADGIVSVDRRGSVLTWNDGAERLFGVTEAAAVGRPFASLVTACEGGDVSSLVALVLAGEPEGRAELACHRPDGGTSHVEVRSAPVKDTTGKVIAVSLVARDVTDRKRLEEDLKRRVDELAEADRRKDEYLAMLAHELRNPLAPLRNALAVLQIRVGDPTAVEEVRGMMDRQVRHMGRIVDDLLDVSRIVRGRLALKPERVELGHLVRTVVGDHEAAFRAAGVTLAYEASEAPAWVVGDETRLTQILDNLLANAMKFTPAGGTVTVRVTRENEGTASVVVRDTGVGVDSSVLPRLFDTFAQAEQGLARSQGGLGLGLALVKGLSELHGGSVHAASDGPGTGAEFTVTLPTSAEPAALSGSPASPPQATSGKVRVLVVEDNRDAADSLRMLLELYGYEVSVAYTGTDGLAAAKREQPDVVVCDIGLPGMSGYEVASTLRQNGRMAKARLIAVTGYGQDEARLKALQAGFDYHLVKPIDPEDLGRLVAEPVPGK